MDKKNPGSGYSNWSIALHWFLALALLSQLFLGTIMVDIPKGPESDRAYWFNLHKSVGICLAIFIILRIICRLKYGAPDPLPSMKSWQKLASSLNHKLLYLCMILMPTTGFIGSLYSKYPIKFFGFPIARVVEPNPVIKEITSEIHAISAILFFILIAIHIVAALKHLLIDCDEIFQRMMFRNKSKQSN